MGLATLLVVATALCAHGFLAGTATAANWDCSPADYTVIPGPPGFYLDVRETIGTKYLFNVWMYQEQGGIPYDLDRGDYQALFTGDIDAQCGDPDLFPPIVDALLW